MSLLNFITANQKSPANSWRGYLLLQVSGGIRPAGAGASGWSGHGARFSCRFKGLSGNELALFVALHGRQEAAAVGGGAQEVVGGIRLVLVGFRRGFRQAGGTKCNGRRDGKDAPYFLK